MQLEYAEKKDKDKRLGRLHEELALRLYSTQQELHKRQQNLEEMATVEDEVKAKRKHAEATLEQGIKDLQAEQKELDGYVTKLSNARRELNELKFTLRQAQAYNEQLEADIKLKRRETYKEHATLEKRETEKMHQDFLIDGLKEKIRDLSDQKRMYESQAAAQQTEIEAANAALREAQHEIETIAADKQRLLQQWRSSVVGMQRREEALHAIKQMVKQQEEKELNIEAEMRDVQATIRETQEQNENLTAKHNTHTRQLETIQVQIANVERDVEMAEKQNSLVQKSVHHTLQEGLRADVAVSQLRNQVKLVENSIKKTSQENTALNDQVVALLSNQSTLNRAAANASKRAQKLNDQCKRKEEEFEQVQNDTVRKRVETLELKAQNTSLKANLKRVQQALAEKEKLIDQYEAEIKKGHIEIDKKQELVEKLNKEYDERRSTFDDDSTGPLEAKIKNMRCISAKKDEQLISQQKRIRLTSAIALNSKEIREMQTAIKQMRTDMSRVNQIIVKKVEKQQVYERETQSLTHDFDLRMAEHQKVEARLAETVQSIRDEKSKLEEELVEAERQIMLWERKIFLEKEMHEALDPAVGQSEVMSMRKEIHRMQLRLEQLKKCQEQMLSEMQRLHVQLQNVWEEVEKTRRETCSLQTETAQLRVRRALNLACILQYQKLVKRLQAATERDACAPLKASTIAAIKRVRNDAKSLAETLDRLRKECPELEVLFDTFYEWAAVISAAAMPPLPASQVCEEVRNWRPNS
ncbi:hypothetical protein BESB_011410 [Besnoitia besnoiti]|uniref:Uncharacterized protein n=1 Tax=Besnoitia besnoiti TaxID=94643 RepID=A0A2A9MLE8_BESBE|nr:hypothetical protein BESB_011410 [Besnoitia besnoiti]PFH38799.1 hypothetical protein BESB_011410 [Besnoitia besnoiti]